MKNVFISFLMYSIANETTSAATYDSIHDMRERPQEHARARTGATLIGSAGLVVISVNTAFHQMQRTIILKYFGTPD